MLDPSLHEGQFELITLNEQTKKLRASNLTYLYKSFMKDVLSSERISTKQDNTTLFYQSKLGDSVSSYGSPIKTNQLKDKNVCYAPVFAPEMRILIFWNFFFLIQLIIQMFYIPYYLAVKLIVNKPSWVNLILNQSIPIISYFLDIFITLNTSVYKKGRIYKNRKKILVHYLQGNFGFDVIVIVSQILATYSEFQTDVLLILKFFRLYQVMKRLETRLSLKERFRWFVVTKLVLNLFYVIHYCGCAFLIIGLLEHQADTKSWINAYKIDLNDVNFLYVYSIYWSTITLLTVGYGDITPQTSVERIYCILISMVTIGVVGYVINSIGQSLKDMNEKEEYKNTRMALLDIFLQKNKIPQTLCLRIKDYYDHFYKNQFQQAQQDFEVTENLDPQLKRELFLQMYKLVLLNSNYIREHVSVRCLEELCQVVKEKNFIAGETIFHKNKETKSLAFLRSGSVSIGNVSLEKVKQQTQTLTHKGEVINEIAFLRQEDRPFDTIAVTKCQILLLSFNDFISILKTFPEDYERYQFFRQSDQENQQFRQLQFCELCSEQHLTQNCSQLFYAPNRMSVILDHIRPKINERRAFLRRKRLKLELLEIQNGVLQRLLEDYEFDDHLSDSIHLERLGFLDMNNIQEQSKAIHQSLLPQIAQLSDESESDQSSVNEVKHQKDLKKDYKSLFSYNRTETILQNNKQLSNNMNPKFSDGKLSCQKANSIISEQKQNLLKIRRSILGEQIFLRQRSSLKDDKFSIINFRPAVINKIPVFPSQAVKNQKHIDLTRKAKYLEDNNEGYFQQRLEQESSKFRENSATFQKQPQMNSLEISVPVISFGEDLPDLDINQTYQFFFPCFNIQRVLDHTRKNSQFSESFKHKILRKFQRRQNGGQPNKIKQIFQLKKNDGNKL